MSLEDLTSKLISGQIERPDGFQPLKLEFLEEVEYGFRERKKCYRVTTSSGFELNSLTEDRINFCDLPGTRKCETCFGDVYIDLQYYLGLGEEGGVSISHEIGHILNPDNLELIVSPSIDADKGTNDYYIDVFHKFLKQNNEVMRTEVEAWEHGKIIADIIGINEDLYNQRMTNALKTYFIVRTLWMIDDIKNLLQRDLVDYSELVEYYDIWAQETIQISMKELIDRTLPYEDEYLKIRDKIRAQQSLEDSN